MVKADRLMSSYIEEILAHGYKDINPRPKYADGTPAHTISVNHTFRKYDLSSREFPICTLRPQAWKTGIKEIDCISSILRIVGVPVVAQRLRTHLVFLRTRVQCLALLSG